MSAEWGDEEFGKVHREKIATGEDKVRLDALIGKRITNLAGGPQYRVIAYEYDPRAAGVHVSGQKSIHRYKLIVVSESGITQGITGGFLVVHEPSVCTLAAGHKGNHFVVPAEVVESRAKKVVECGAEFEPVIL